MNKGCDLLGQTNVSSGPLAEFSLWADNSSISCQVSLQMRGYSEGLSVSFLWPKRTVVLYLEA